MKTYHAIVWDNDPEKPGQRVTVLAENLEAAQNQLEGKYGVGRVFDLHNEEDAARPR